MTTENLVTTLRQHTTLDKSWLFNNPTFIALKQQHCPNSNSLIWFNKLLREFKLLVTGRGKLQVIDLGKIISDAADSDGKTAIDLAQQAQGLVSLVRNDLQDLKSFEEILVTKMTAATHPEIYSPHIGRVRIQPSLYDDWMLIPGFAIYQKLDVKSDRVSIRGKTWFQELKPIPPEGHKWSYLASHTVPKVNI